MNPHKELSAPKHRNPNIRHPLALWGLRLAAEILLIKFPDSMEWYVSLPFEASSCHYRGLIDKVIRESRSSQHFIHIYPTCWIFYLPSIDTVTRGSQFNVLSKQHPAVILLVKVPFEILSSPPRD